MNKYPMDPNAAGLWAGFLLLAITLVLLAMLSGCQTADYQEGSYTGQGLTASYTAAPVPGYVVTTHEDGSQTVTPLLPLSAPYVASTTKQKVVPVPVPPPVLQTPPNKSPVVSTKIVTPQAGVAAYYNLTPEIVKKGDGFTASRVCTWAGEAPGTAAEKVATQKIRAIHNPMPSIFMDSKGVQVGKGGGSVEDQAGQSWWQRTVTWFSDLFKGWSMWLLVIGLCVAGFFILPIFLPFLGPIFASIADGLHKMWDWTTGEISRLFAWFKTVPVKKTVAPVVLVTPLQTTDPASGAPADATVTGSGVKTGA